jgi:DNA replication licensing factor MCM4
MQSSFRRQRGFLDVNRLLNAPTFNKERAPLDGRAQDAPSSTGLLNHGGAGAEMSSTTQVIWGTNINASEVSNKLKNFIHTFVLMRDDDNEDEDMQYETQPIYIQKLREIKEMEESVLPVDCDHVFQYDQGLYRQIVDYPSDAIPIFDLVVSQVYQELFSYGPEGNRDEGEDHEDVLLQVRPFNMRKIYRIRELDPNQIDQLVALRGIVIRCSDVIPEMKEAAFTCFKCGREE